MSDIGKSGTIEKSEPAVDIFSLGQDPVQAKLKSKISDSLEKLNEHSDVFDEIISDFNVLYKKYILTLEVANDQKIYNSLNAVNAQNDISNMDKNEFSKVYMKLQEELNKEKSTNMQNTQNLNKSYEYINQIREKMYELEKQKNTLVPENQALKNQVMALEKKKKELNEAYTKLESQYKQAVKEKEEIELKHKELMEKSSKLLMENEIMKNKILEMQNEEMSKLNKYNELMAAAKDKSEAANLFFNQNQQKFEEENKEEINEAISKVSFSEEVKIPTKVKFKQKCHSRVITSITFNSMGSSYITSGADYIVRIYDATKNTETNVFSGFSASVSEACYDHTETMVFAGSLDKTAKLWSIKNNKLLNTFTGHIDYINAVKSFNAQPKALTGSSDRTIREWDFNDLKLIKKYNCVSACYSLGMSPDDSFFLSGHKDGSVRLWATGSDKPDKIFNIHDDQVSRLEMLKNDFQFISVSKDETIKLFDIRKEQTIYTLNDSQINQRIESSIGISSDKKYFAVGSVKGTIYIVRINDFKIESKFNNKSTNNIVACTWRPYNSQIYLGDSGGYLTIWTGGIQQPS